MASKETKTREQLSAIILSRLKPYPECCALSGVAIAPVVKPRRDHPNWHAAFFMKGRGRVPHIAWVIGSEVAVEFDLA
jgi:hypothetical protein